MDRSGVCLEVEDSVLQGAIRGIKGASCFRLGQLGKWVVYLLR